jgi:Helix-turn-helix domain
MTHEMTLAELLALPVSVDLETAGRALGMGRTKAHELARQQEFPCRVLRVGKKYRVPRSALFEALGLGPSAAGSPAGDAA